jgi:hypothetical protein
MTDRTALVQKLWNYCNILRDDGLSYGDYVEQLTFLLFLKMADEQSWPPFNKPSAVPKAYAWPMLLAKDGDELETHYRHVEELGKQKGNARGHLSEGAEQNPGPGQVAAVDRGGRDGLIRNLQRPASLPQAIPESISGRLNSHHEIHT